MEPRELRKALSLGAVLMAMTGSYTLVKTARDSLFLSLLPATWLPWVYLGVGIVTLVVSMAIERLSRNLSPLRSLITTAAIATIGLALFAAVLDRNGPWLPGAFYLFVNAYGLVIISQFWMYTSNRSDPREMKRICGIIGSGAILGGLGGGALAAALGSRLSLAWLIALGSGVLSLSIPMLAILRQESRAGESPAEVREQPTGPLLRVRYVRWLGLATLCSVVVTGVLDYQLKIAVQQAYPTSAQLTSFFGRFYVAMNVIALAIQLMGTRRLLHWLGAGSAALVLPAGLALGAGAILVLPGFTTVVGTRLWDQVVRFSLNKSAVELLFLPLSPDVKRRAKAFVGAGIERFGDALAGLLILGVGVVHAPSTSALASAVLVLVTVWLAATWRLRHAYVRELGRHLRRMTLDWVHEPVSLNERTVLKETVYLLNSPYERVVIQAMDLLEQNAPRLLDHRLSALLEHPSASVRARALERLVASPVPADVENLMALARDSDPRVRLMALRAHCKRGDKRPLTLLDEYFSCDDHGMRSAALACVLEQMNDDELPPVRDLVERYLLTGAAEDRLAVAEALSARTVPRELHSHLVPLLDDTNLQVRCAALRGVGCAGLLAHVPALIQGLGHRDTAAAAHAGLLALGDDAVGDLEASLNDHETPLEIRRAIPIVLGDLATPRSVQALFDHRACHDVILSYRILKACNRLRRSNSDLVFPEDLIMQDLESDVQIFLQMDRHADSHTGVATDGGKHSDAAERAEQFLALVLRERTAQSYNRVFRRLALLYPPLEIFSVYLGTMSEDARVRAHAVEYIDRALSSELRSLVLPLLPGAKSAERDELAKTRFSLPRMTALESLATLLDSHDMWLRTCALYVVGARKEQALRRHVAANLASPDVRVHDTAAWAEAEFACERTS